MKKIYKKLILAVLALVLSAAMLTSVTYAWLVMSKSPAVNSISVAIGGGKTILLAADLTQTAEDGTVLHYPGAFSDTLDFSSHESYAWLNDCEGLAPVSTADGIYWLIPQYDEDGNLLSYEQFTVDDTLEYANAAGGYLCLDFWIVSPNTDCDVRVSMDTKTLDGSYLVEIPDVVLAEDGSYTTAEPQQIIAASARVGFLVDVTTADTSAYRNSPNYDERYTTLYGNYTEQGQSAATSLSTTFTIYEPNGDLHPDDTKGYVKTEPLAYDPWMREIQKTELSADCLSVQMASEWKTATAVGQDASGEPTLLLEAALRAALSGGEENMNLNDAREAFHGFLRGQLSAYLSAGRFYTDTAALYSPTADSVYQTGGASDGAVIVKLAKNVPQRVRMFIWLEGQDQDCRNSGIVRAAQIALKLELAGSTS